MRKIILASASERRAEILKLAGIEFDVHPSGYNEDLSEDLSPRELAEKLALGKALAIAPLHDDAVVIGADTFILLGDKIIGKPKTIEVARSVLSSLSGTSHSVITGYALVDTKSGKRVLGSEVTEVFFRELSAHEIDRYIREGVPNPLELAGGYAIQAGAASFVKRIEGDYYNIVGLPLARVVMALKEFGVRA